MSIERYKLAKQIFDDALERADATERAAWLAQACGDDVQLRQSVEALLRAYEQAGAFLEQPVAGVVRNAASPEAGGTIEVAIPLTEKPGDKIGHYKLLQQIGEGGCGVVYMAEQQEPIRRRVAFKVIKLGMDTKQVIARFEAERQALALMDHPNIARVLDAGSTETGRPYFVMELVRGQRITEYCDENNLSTEERLDLFMQVCHAIQHAHQKGIIHRDIKPSNILVTVVDGEPVPKVIDFGIAKAIGQQLTEKTVFTSFEQFIGTPAYMSPEQAQLSGVDVDTRSDIYSLGVLLYELLTGHTPFDPKTLLSAGLDEMRRMIREQDPPRPSTRISSLDAAERTTVAKRRQSQPPRLIHQVRGDLDWVVMKCLEKNRARRYETANGVAADLERHLKHEPVTAAAPSALYRFEKFVRRNKVALATASALALLLVTGTVVSTWQALRATRAESKERVQRAFAESERGRAELLRSTAEEALYKARLNENRALRLARFQGWSELAFQNLRSNAAMSLPQQNLLELCTEAAACLGDLDVREEARLQSNGKAIWSLDFSPNGALLASADVSGVSWVRQLDTNEVIWTRRDAAASEYVPKPKLAPFPAIRFSPDGAHLAYSTWDHSVEVISLLHPGQAVQQLSALGHAQYLAFDRAGAALAVAWSDNKVVTYDAASGKVLREICLQRGIGPGWREVVALSPDGTALAVVGDHHTIELHQLATNAPPTVLGHHQASVMCLAFSPDGKLLGSASTDHTAKVFDVAAGKELFTLVGHKARVQCVAFRSDNRIIATASDDQTARLWDVHTGQSLLVLRPELGPVLTVAFSPNGRRLAVACEATALYCLVNEGARQVLFGHSYAVTGLAFHPDQPVLASASGDNSIRLWNLTSAVTERRLPGHPAGQSCGIGFSPDGALLVAGHDGYSNYGPTNHDIRVLETATGSLRHAFSGHNSDAPNVAFDPSGKLIASGDHEGVTLVHDCSTGAIRQRWAHTNAPVIGVHFLSPQHLIMAHSCGHLRLGDCQSGQIIAAAEAVGPLTSLTVAPAQGRLALGSDGGLIQLFALPKLSLVTTLQGGPGNANAVALSADGRLLASGGQASQVRIWDVMSGIELLKLPRQESPIIALAFEPAGSRLAISGVEEQITVWDLGLVHRRLNELGIEWASPKTQPLPWGNAGRWGDASGRGLPIPAQGVREEGLAGNPQEGSLPQNIERHSPTGAALRIPPRDSKARTNLVDLSMFYNGDLRANWHGDVPENNLAHLPVGVHTLGGVEFDLRGLVQVGYSWPDLAISYPKVVSGIPINQQADRLHFLHAAMDAGKAGAGLLIGRYVVHFVDGQSREIPIVVGADLDDWWEQDCHNKPYDVAWTGSNGKVKPLNLQVHLFKRTWENPLSNVAIQSLDFESTHDKAFPFLVAITAE